MLPSACGLRQHFHAQGHSSSPYGLTLSRQITCLYFFCSKLVLQITNGFVYATLSLNRVVGRLLTALQAATILVAMTSGKNFWRPKFWQKSGDGDHFTVKGPQKATF